MKVDVLLKTRGLKSDYRWVYCPEYVDEVFEDKMSFLIQMMQKSSMKDFLLEEGLHNIYFIHDENGSVLIRGGFSESTDVYGRTIYAIEGLACPAEESRVFWYALPYLIDRLSGVPLLRDQWMENQSEPGQVQSRQISFPSLTEDCLFMDRQEPGSLWQQILDKSLCMEKLMADIQASDRMFNFVYGTRNKSFYPVSVGRYYTPEEVNRQPAIGQWMVDTTIAPVIHEAENLYRIEIQTGKQAKRFEACLVARDAAGEAIAETEAMTFGKDGIDIAQLERARMAVNRKLQSVGYGRGRKKTE